MRATLEFDTEKDDEGKIELLRVVKATDMAMFIWELQHNFWRKWKHNEDDFTLDNYREELAEMLIEYHIDTEELM